MLTGGKGVCSSAGLMACRGDACLGKRAVLASGTRKRDPHCGENRAGTSFDALVFKDGHWQRAPAGS